VRIVVRGGKHGPNRLSSYREIHETVMQQFLRGGFVRSENLSFNDLGDGFIEMEGVIECDGGIYIEVRKRIEILDGDGADALVQTVDYSYNAAIRGVGNILRYDSPHPDHNREHHVHRFDVFAGVERRPPIFILDESARPTLGEVIEEVQAWYYANLDQLLDEVGEIPS
jgi:hypothetical protein